MEPLNATVLYTADKCEVWCGTQNGEAAFAASGSSITVIGRRDVWFATGGTAARVFHSIDQGLTWSVANTPMLSRVRYG